MGLFWGLYSLAYGYGAVVCVFVARGHVMPPAHMRACARQQMLTRFVVVLDTRWRGMGTWAM